MLQVGDIGLSITEQYSHYALWVLMASPLLVGSDVSMLTNTSLTILGNTEVTAINQDKLGVQGIPIASQLTNPATATCWSKALADGSVAVILLNTGDTDATISCAFKDLGVAGNPSKSNIRDLWAKGGYDGDVAGGTISAKLASHAHRFVKISK
jgi:alpha-galactosidase|eukprot:COSAG01_NODE_1485_length_10131_cov_10.500995_7_plen_154_part_00